jgi:hypothetical protein
LTYKVLDFRVIGREAIESFHNNNLILFIKVQDQDSTFFLMSKWSEGFLDLGFQRACKQTFLVPKFLILIFIINIG